MRLNELIDDYNATHGVALNNKQDYLKGLTEEELLNSLRNFGATKINGKSHFCSHFKNNRWYNLKQTTNEGVETQLRDELIKAIKTSQMITDSTIHTFVELYLRIENIVKELNGIGIKGAAQMTKYDLAFYIASHKSINPLQLYLHRGVRDGALYLKIITNSKLDCILEIEEIYKSIPELEQLGGAHHIENFLCIFKKQLLDI